LLPERLTYLSSRWRGRVSGSVTRASGGGAAGGPTGPSSDSAHPDLLCAGLVFDRSGVPLWVGGQARALGDEWGGDGFWSAVGQGLCALGAQRVLTLLVRLESGDDADGRDLATIVGARDGAGRILSVLLASATSATTGAASRGTNRTTKEGWAMELKELVHKLTDFIWAREQQTRQSAETAILSYVQDAVLVEIEYRRRMHELDRRLSELEGARDAVMSS